jgi:outer membrane protein OmpA-like peptidoglycan-associated protein
VNVLALLLGACASVGTLQADHRTLVADLSKAQATPWAMQCAPRELALADAHREFAELEFQQGDARRAAEHVAVAHENVEQALAKAAACTPQDRDADGVVDDADKCPDVPEDKDGEADGDGCPDLDKDGDGLGDGADACPDRAEDLDAFQDADGCPDEDDDADGIADVEDACRDVPEDRDGDRDDDGCPEDAADRDGDGIADATDKCPDEPESKNDYLDGDGCPDERPSQVRITHEQIEINEKIQFEVNRSRILPVSYGILDQVAQVMRDYPAISIRIEGHTDSDGSDDYNQKLSQQRADAVLAYLVSQGLAQSRMTAAGLGETQPVDTNRTADGRSNNRRVEFHITGGM